MSAPGAIEVVRRILIIGAGGRLGAALLRSYSAVFEVTGWGHAELDLADLSRVRERVAELEFDLLINCAALTNVDYCETHRDEAMRVNADAPGLLSEICSAKSARLIHVSTDYVFDGDKEGSYTEEDPARPISIYGESKLAGEQRVLYAMPEALVVRLSWVFGPDRPSFIDQVIARARSQAETAAIADKFAIPTYTIDLAQSIRVAWENQCAGILHLANSGACSWQEYGQHALDCCRANGMKLMATEVAPLRLADMKNFVARRPRNSVLSIDKFTLRCRYQPRHWREAVSDYIANYVAKR